MFSGLNNLLSASKNKGIEKIISEREFKIAALTPYLFDCVFLSR